MKINPIIFMGLSLKSAMGIGLERYCGGTENYYYCDAGLVCVPFTHNNAAGTSLTSHMCIPQYNPDNTAGPYPKDAN